MGGQRSDRVDKSGGAVFVGQAPGLEAEGLISGLVVVKLGDGPMQAAVIPGFSFVGQIASRLPDLVSGVIPDQCRAWAARRPPNSGVASRIASATSIARRA